MPKKKVKIMYIIDKHLRLIFGLVTTIDIYI